jgi:hypothetical protein
MITAEKQLVKLQKLVADTSDNHVELKGLISSGNIKIPTSTAIFNMSSATDCMSMKLGLCAAAKAGVKCYARKSEVPSRPSVLPYRRRQEKYWLGITARKFALNFLAINAVKARQPFTALRLNEAGDFHSQECVGKANNIARILSDFGIATYCYTSRSDLDYSEIKSLTVMGSGFRKEGITSEFRIIPKGEDKPKGYGLCVGNCKICNRCQKRGMLTAVPAH